MDNAFSRLAKVISLERKQGYRNKAVIGGLDKFASRWETDARAETADQAAVSVIVSLLIGYPSVTEQSARERIIEQIQRRLRDVNADPGKPVDVTAGESEPSHLPADQEPGERTPGVNVGNEPRQRSQNLPGASADIPVTGPGPRPGETAGRQASAPRSATPPGRRPRPEPDRSQDAPRTVPQESYSSPETPVALTKTASADETAGHVVPDEHAEPKGSPQQAGGSGANGERPARLVPARSKPDAMPSSAGQAVTPPAAGVQSRPESTRSEFPVTDSYAASAPAEVPPALTDEEDEPRQKEGVEAESASASVERAENERIARSELPGRGLDAPVTRLPSVGPSYAEKLSKLGVETVRDLLFLLPRRYDDYSQLRTIDKLRYGEEVTVIGTIWQVESRIIGENRRLVIAVVGDGTGEMQMTWFNPYVERQLHIGRPFVFSGKIDSHRGRFVMSNPEFEPLERDQIHTARLVPIYPLTQGISGRWLRKVIKSAVDAWANNVPDFLPEHIRQGADLLPRAAALSQIHFPDSREMLAAAHRRLSFDEFLVLQLGVMSQRQHYRGLSTRPLCADAGLLAPFLAALPFSMTAAQRRALDEIGRDLAGSQPMSRLLQGDVGSGKTAVAAAALWVAVANGGQGAIMAPTEILAEQHARSFQALFAGLTRPGTDRPVQVALLTGRSRRAEREVTLTALAAGDIDIVVGTHALIQNEVNFRQLSVAVVDEQHRFGVEQRGALRQKGMPPHMLVMSATPIPRSLALTIYGDLDVSVIDEMPAGRTPIKTKWLTPTQRERAYGFIRRQVQEGRQAFIIYPLVENSEHSEAKAAVDEHLRLQATVFPDLRVGLLHGRLKSDEKDSVMRAFADHELDVLVATSVVEVGIDVPNATVIMIEGAEHFGLAQLHQFRGRVGRGEYPSYCILISDASEGDSAQRLQALETSNDGFALAQTDLEMRGPGDFFGTRQSGLPPLELAQLSDVRTLEAARTAAQQILAIDPDLSRPEHRGLAAQVSAFWRHAGDVS